MTKKKNNTEDDREKLRFENEMKKIKMTLEKGAVFSEPSNHNDLPPEVESEFLKNIEMFDKAYDSAKRVSLYDFIGRPVFKKSNKIPDSKINAELEKIMQILNDNGIVLETLCDVDERVLYSFITEELFLHEIDDIRIEGMVSHFIYEEFHPNHDYDIRNHSNDFIRSFLDKSSDFYTTFLTKDAENDKSFQHIREAFSTFSLNHFEIMSLSFDEQHANVIFKIDFSGIIENSNEEVHYTGEGNIEMIYIYDYWCVQKIIFPLFQNPKNSTI